jgi:Ankyrin repeat
MGLWRSAGAVRCRPRYCEERSRRDPCGGKDLPDLQAPGRDGATLLNFAVRQSWQRPESVETVKTLLSLGADPNYTNGERNFFAMANAVHASAPVLRAMLDAGGNPNTRDEVGRPIILMN